jgi:hypothetical protein
MISQGSHFEALMQTAFDAHLYFTATWKKDLAKTGNLNSVETAVARDKFLREHNRLFDELQRYEKGFSEGSHEAIDAVIAFIEVDIPAFRTGYAKERFYRRLKSLRLSEEHIARLRTVALEQCASPSYRREFTYLTRLMIKLADQPFLDELIELSFRVDGFAASKTQRMIKAIIDNRMDLE